MRAEPFLGFPLHLHPWSAVLNYCSSVSPLVCRVPFVVGDKHLLLSRLRVCCLFPVWSRAHELSPGEKWIHSIGNLYRGHVYTAPAAGINAVASVEWVCVGVPSRWESTLPSTQLVHLPDRWKTVSTGGLLLLMQHCEDAPLCHHKSKYIDRRYAPINHCCPWSIKTMRSLSVTFFLISNCVSVVYYLETL